ncbi:MAG TPA: transporter substrate-binding domain-containing protein [Clostridia bacterium]|nr:transporter substrate-binding domain-containing protein [Clostridia bacterium]
MAVFLIIVLIFSFANFYFVTTYNQSLVSFLLNDEKLTEEEKVWLNEHEPFLYAADNNAPPLRFLNKETGQYEGVVIDYINELSIELGVKINVRPLVWDDALKSLEKGTSDFCDMFPSESRSEKFVFSDPIYYENGVIVTRSNNRSIETMEDLSGKSLAIQKGDFIEEFLRERVEGINFYYTNDYQESLYLLNQGTVDATGGDEPVLSYFIKDLSLESQVRILEKPIYEMPMILALPKDQTKLRDITNKGIRILKKKNTMSRIQQKWFGISRPLTQDNTKEILEVFFQILLVIFVIAFIIIYYWNRELNERIKKGVQRANIAKQDIEIVFNNLPYFFIIINNDYQILKTNEPFLNLVDAKEENVIHQNLLSYEIFSSFKNMKFEAGVLKEEFTYDDQYYTLSTVTLTNSNKNQRILVIIENITFDKLRENQLIHSNKIAALGQLAAGVTHEIRNPLGLIRNYTYIIENELYTSKSELIENTNGINNALDSVNEFINNLLNFSRISSDRKEIIYLKDFFSEVKRLSHRNLENNDIDLEIHCEEENVFFNRESLKHIFFNLISNASDSIVNKGKIVIKCKSLNEDYTIISVKDDGKGIKKENIDKIFDPFFTTKYPEQGTGLGLNFVHKEITENKGKIHVISEYLDGAEFILTLPTRGVNNEE